MLTVAGLLLCATIFGGTVSAQAVPDDQPQQFQCASSPADMAETHDDQGPAQLHQCDQGVNTG
jgi:hypothetical protein